MKRTMNYLKAVFMGTDIIDWLYGEMKENKIFSHVVREIYNPMNAKIYTDDNPEKHIRATALGCKIFIDTEECQTILKIRIEKGTKKIEEDTGISIQKGAIYFSGVICGDDTMRYLMEEIEIMILHTPRNTNQFMRMGSEPISLTWHGDKYKIIPRDNRAIVEKNGAEIGDFGYKINGSFYRDTRIPEEFTTSLRRFFKRA